MFGRFRRPEEPTIYDEPIGKILESMSTFSPEDDEYSRMVDYLERLSKLKAEKHKSGLDPNTVAIVLGNLAGILTIVMYEQKNVMSSAAKGFILRAK